MSDAVVFPLIALVAAGLIALALVWPQGQGAPSPAPFGHPAAPFAMAALAPGKPPLPLRGAEPAPVAARN